MECVEWQVSLQTGMGPGEKAKVPRTLKEQETMQIYNAERGLVYIQYPCHQERFLAHFPSLGMPPVVLPEQRDQKR